MPDAALQPFTVSSFRLDKNGLTPVGSPSFTDWFSCGLFIKQAEQSVQFWIGDWLLYGEKHFKKTDYERAMQETGLDYQTLRNYKWVAAKVPMSLRNDKLSYHHHKEVANLPKDKQKTLLKQAEKETWSLVKLKQAKFQLLQSLKRFSPKKFDKGFLLGDCRALLATLPDESIDLVVTDPPYGIDYESEHRDVNPFSKLENDSLEQALPLLDETLALLVKKMKSNSHCYIFASWKTYPLVQRLIEKYFHPVELLIWVKNHWTQGDLDANYGQVHEFILLAHKGVKRIQKPGQRATLHFDRVPENGRQHPTEKPVPLLKYLIEQSSSPHALVCDPFAGVASTLIAAKETLRRYIGMEIDTRWFNAGQVRLA